MRDGLRRTAHVLVGKVRVYYFPGRDEVSTANKVSVASLGHSLATAVAVLSDALDCQKLDLPLFFVCDTLNNLSSFLDRLHEFTSCERCD
jgi:hypothetical protein